MSGGCNSQVLDIQRRCIEPRRVAVDRVELRGFPGKLQPACDRVRREHGFAWSSSRYVRDRDEKSVYLVVPREASDAKQAAESPPRRRASFADDFAMRRREADGEYRIFRADVLALCRTPIGMLTVSPAVISTCREPIECRIRPRTTCRTSSQFG